MRQNGLAIDDDIIKHIQVIEFDTSKYDINMNEYINNILDSKIVFENNEFKNLFNKYNIEC